MYYLRAEVFTLCDSYKTGSYRENFYDCHVVLQVLVMLFNVVR